MPIIKHSQRESHFLRLRKIALDRECRLECHNANHHCNISADMQGSPYKHQDRDAVILWIFDTQSICNIVVEGAESDRKKSKSSVSYEVVLHLGWTCDIDLCPQILKRRHEAAGLEVPVLLQVVDTESISSQGCQSVWEWELMIKDVLHSQKVMPTERALGLTNQTKRKMRICTVGYTGASI